MQTEERKGKASARLRRCGNKRGVGEEAGHLGQTCPPSSCYLRFTHLYVCLHLDVAADQGSARVSEPLVTFTMDRKFLACSSLAKRFFELEDYNDVEVMPLTGLSASQQQVYHEHVVPLMEAHGAGLEACCRQVDRLCAALAAQPDDDSRQQLYQGIRGVADWVQSSLALVLVDAAEREACADGRVFYAALQAADPTLFEVCACVHKQIRPFCTRS